MTTGQKKKRKTFYQRQTVFFGTKYIFSQGQSGFLVWSNILDTIASLAKRLQLEVLIVPKFT